MNFEQKQFTLFYSLHTVESLNPKIDSSYNKTLTEQVSDLKLHFRSNGTRTQKGVGKNGKVRRGSTGFGDPCHKAP